MSRRIAPSLPALDRRRIEDPRSRHAVETTERFVEGIVDKDELQAAAELAMSDDDGGGVQVPVELGTSAASPNEEP